MLIFGLLPMLRVKFCVRLRLCYLFYCVYSIGVGFICLLPFEFLLFVVMLLLDLRIWWIAVDCFFDLLLV